MLSNFLDITLRLVTMYLPKRKFHCPSCTMNNSLAKEIDRKTRFRITWCLVDGKFLKIVIKEINQLLKEKKLLERKRNCWKENFENMRNVESADHQESFKIDCINNPFLPGKRKSRS